MLFWGDRGWVGWFEVVMQHTTQAYTYIRAYRYGKGEGQPPSWADVVRRFTHSGWMEGCRAQTEDQGLVCMEECGWDFPLLCPQSKVHLGRSQDDSVCNIACGRDGECRKVASRFPSIRPLSATWNPQGLVLGNGTAAQVGDASLITYMHIYTYGHEVGGRPDRQPGRMAFCGTVEGDAAYVCPYMLPTTTSACNTAGGA